MNGRGIVVVLVTLLASASALAATPAKPAVAVTSMSPVTVAGRAFRVGERVRVVVSVKQTHVTTAVANRRGRFVVRYAFAVGDCTILRVRARGNKGSSASFAILPSCAQPRSG